jgi:hypothetical protein
LSVCFTGRNYGRTSIVSGVHARPSLFLMRAVATGLLALMIVLFLLARRFEDIHPAMGYLRAFAEAATVGALADWFAVTALFRRPLGLPIPHTAIIPRSKDRIGAGLGYFLETNFLSPELLSSRLAEIDLLGAGADWILQPGRSKLVARAAAESLPRVLDLIDDRPVEEALKTFTRGRLREIDLSSTLADALSFLTTEGRHRGILDHLIRVADSLLTESRPISARECAPKAAPSRACSGSISAPPTPSWARRAARSAKWRPIRNAICAAGSMSRSMGSFRICAALPICAPRSKR